MTQQRIDEDQRTIGEFYATYPMFNPEHWLYQKAAFDTLSAWVDMNSKMDPTDPKQFAAFLRWLQKGPYWEDFKNQVEMAGGTLDGVRAVDLYMQFMKPMQPAQVMVPPPMPIPEPEPAKSEEDSDPIPGIALPHPVERFLIHAITAMDPDAEIRARLIYAYIFDVGTSIVTALSAARGADAISVAVAIAINIAGSFAELLFRFSMTLFMHSLRWRTKAAGDFVLLILFVCLNFAMIVGAGALYVWNFTMTVNFLHVFAPARLVIFDFTLPISIGAIAGVFLTGLMSVVQLEYVLRNVRKN